MKRKGLSTIKCCMRGYSKGRNALLASLSQIDKMQKDAFVRWMASSEKSLEEPHQH